LDGGEFGLDDLRVVRAPLRRYGQSHSAGGDERPADAHARSGRLTHLAGTLGGMTDEFPPYDEWSSVEVEAAEVPSNAFDPEAADFNSEGVEGEHGDGAGR
jgi:hypothetical protein